MLASTSFQPSLTRYSSVSRVLQTANVIQILECSYTVISVKEWSLDALRSLMLDVVLCLGIFLGAFLGTGHVL